jgi:prepilin-type N-terminal cleavage/methylation domain-containing protein
MGAGRHDGGPLPSFSSTFHIRASRSFCNASLPIPGKKLGPALCTGLSVPRGFGLIEVLVAIALLSSAMLPLATLLAMAARTAATVQHRSTAAVLASQKVEQLRGQVILAETPERLEYLDAAGNAACAGEVGCDARAYTVSWSTVTLPLHGDAMLISVVVSHVSKMHGQVRTFAVRPRSVR